ncbi:DUF3306 domain-containing protein [Massilia sp. YIM B02763]|uniref:DUF3306 domain-containing protein n=1 Tax=Massilia sp. YIM B02763 TaxID=3050130 RepID=UPI0025B6BEFB|nr:DUF3306 domain-containing protein [Massilia sp. YIM B02763]MDN4051947.1 DUF3306 domain-containing protein [Massilia sp. YIM B02763]
MTDRAMPDEGFLRRWSRRKTETKLGVAPAEEASTPLRPVTAVPAEPAPELEPPAPVRLPTLDDVAALTGESDFSAFVARGVDGAVRRTALKKLFADPHFNTMDGLDVYIDDYTKPSPVSDAMLASLDHAKSVFRHLIDDEPDEAAPRPDVPPPSPEPAEQLQPAPPPEPETR